MGELFIIFVVLAVFSALLILGNYLAKNDMLKKICMGLTVILTFFIGYMQFSSFPTNFIVQKIIALVICVLIPAVIVALYFIKKINLSIFKLAISIMLTVSVVYLMFV